MKHFVVRLRDQLYRSSLPEEALTRHWQALIDEFDDYRLWENSTSTDDALEFLRALAVHVCQQGDVIKVQQLLQSIAGQLILGQDATSLTNELSVAAMSAPGVVMLKWLVEESTLPVDVSCFSNRMLRDAVGFQDMEKIKYLIESAQQLTDTTVDINASGEFDVGTKKELPSALCLAITSGSLELLTYFFEDAWTALEASTPFNTQLDAAFRVAVSSHQPAIFKYLTKIAQELEEDNATLAEFFQPLLKLAVDKHEREIIEFLIFETAIFSDTSLEQVSLASQIPIQTLRQLQGLVDLLQIPYGERTAYFRNPVLVAAVQSGLLPLRELQEAVATLCGLSATKVPSRRL